MLFKMGFSFGSDGKQKVAREFKGKYRREMPADYTLIDLETTGLDNRYDRIIEIGAIKVKDNKVTDEFNVLIRYPNGHVPSFITELTGITNQMIERYGKPLDGTLQDFYLFIGDDILVGYNVNFDINFLYDAMLKENLKLKNDYVDLLPIARKIESSEKSHRLKDMIKLYNLNPQNHRALDDCLVTYDIYNNLLKKMEENPNILKRTLKTAKDFVPSTDTINEDNPLFEKLVCFTGTLDNLVRDDAKQLVVDLGGKPQNDITLKTNFLVLGDISYSNNVKGNETSKMKKARQNILKGQDLTILSEQVFIDMINDYYEEKQ